MRKRIIEQGKKEKKPAWGDHAYYRKRPVVIEAWQFTKENIKKGIPDFVMKARHINLYSRYGGTIIGGTIHTLEGQMEIMENDYIVKDVIGLYPCKPDVFEQTHELMMDLDF